MWSSVRGILFLIPVGEDVEWVEKPARMVHEMLDAHNPFGFVELGGRFRLNGPARFSLSDEVGDRSDILYDDEIFELRDIPGYWGREREAARVDELHGGQLHREKCQRTSDPGEPELNIHV